MLAGRRRFILLVALTAALCLATFRYWYQIHTALAYATRPLWDTPDGPREVIAHYHADGVAPADLCALHGWEPRVDAEGREREVWDAVLVSTELDLLEIRLHELDGHVDRFFIIESNRTFTGLPKRLYFGEQRDAAPFRRFAHKIVYKALEGPHQPDAVEADAWAWEAAQRDAMTALIRAHLPRATPGAAPARAPLVVMSDVDELPAAHTLALLRACQFGAVLHLQLRNYVYSFEWPAGWGSWRAQVHEWGKGTFYRHSMAGGVALADAGWHCSYCFRSVEDVAAKMQGFSHADRLGGDASLLSPQRIQRVMCEGKDIFNMLPEAYSYKDMLQLLKPVPSKSAVGLPRYLIENAKKFKYLLPGGCMREG